MVNQFHWRESRGKFAVDARRLLSCVMHSWRCWTRSAKGAFLNIRCEQRFRNAKGKSNTNMYAYV